MKRSLVVIGGGAAGFFAAIHAAASDDQLEVTIIEKSQQVLSKVKVSGGGRCNVTHACFEPKQLVKNYPRGAKELLGPFHAFQPGDMFDWLEQRGVALKTEEDGRVFPVTDKSQTIIDCFLEEARKVGVRVRMGSHVKRFYRHENKWHIELIDQPELLADALLIATGSAGSMHDQLAALGHTLVPAVPSLFTFNITDKRIEGLAGVSAPVCEVRIEGTKFTADGPVLVTHWGLSGPGILRLSAWAARELADVKYDFQIRVNWDDRFTREGFIDFLKEWKQEHSRNLVTAFSAAKVPHRLWISLLSDVEGIDRLKWADVSNRQLEKIADAICACYFHVKGKSTFKDEFVTAGGVELKEVDFKTMESKLFPGIYFAGEVLNIDAITGGFNFQAAWTTAWIAAKA
ncbi:MAG: NAD(P)/FAD-dependent oxidoreductase, partial [Flavobacteriales bacterium]